MDRKLQDILEKININKAPYVNNEITDRIIEKTGGKGFYHVFTVDTTVARTNEEFKYTGDRIIVDTIDDEVTIKLNDINNNSINLKRQKRIKGPFKKFYLTNGAGAGALTLIVGSQGMFDAKKVALLDDDGHLQIDVVSGGIAGTEFAEDVAHTTGDKGPLVLVVRKDAGASICDTDGDYTALQVDANGNLRVAGGGGGTQYDEDDAHTTGDTGSGALVVRKDAPASLCDTDGDYSLLIVDANGRCHVLDKNSDDMLTALQLIDNCISGNEAQVDIVASLPAGTNNIGEVVSKKGDSDYTKVHKDDQQTTAQTETTLWDPTAGKKFVITDICVSVDTAMTVTLADASGVKIYEWYFAINGGCVINLQTPYQSTTADNLLLYTSSTAGKISISVEGYEV